MNKRTIPLADSIQSPFRTSAYVNLNRGTNENRIYSCQSASGHDRGLVRLHARSILIHNATFAVQAAGLRKTRVEQRKRVHAVVRGELVAVGAEAAALFNALTNERDFSFLGYNPYKTDHFKLIGDTKRLPESLSDCQALDSVAAAEWVYGDQDSLRACFIDEQSQPI